MPWYKQFVFWLGDFVEDGTTGKPSVKRYGVALGATVLAGVMFGLGSVIGWAVVQTEGSDRVKIVESATQALIDVCMWFVLLVTGNYTLGKFVEKRLGDKEKSPE